MKAKNSFFGKMIETVRMLVRVHRAVRMWAQTLVVTAVVVTAVVITAVVLVAAVLVLVAAVLVVLVLVVVPVALSHVPPDPCDRSEILEDGAPLTQERGA